ncbi:hypothetical protein ATCVMO0605SPH_555R [Acanthocystis turfacea Chlorella virus MO0605SPH]|nr:hypothetical protein ATCVMO0605SPH_555R [Acanthocystis turfacea Chlorella virus MO0605SPH]AGE57019.1 hypothetical protein ATCVNEJV3_570R [Acanthocystis turfacea Chlorella virus NE-JV-3]
MDDVQTILEKGRDETYIFLADSSKRDKAAFPTAAEYEVTFNSQFRNVTKFEILNVNIPRTDYLVDSSECSLKYAIGQPTNINTWQTELTQIRTANITPGDYNLSQLIDEINSQLTAVANAQGDTTVLVASPTTNPNEISNKINLSGSGAFTLLQGSINSTIGFGDPVNVNQAAATGYYTTVPGYTVNYPNGAANVFLAVPGLIPGAPSINEFVGVFPPGDGSSYYPIYTGQILRQYFTAPSAGTPTTVTGYFSDLATAPPGGFALNVAIGYAGNNNVIANGTIYSINSELTPAVSNSLSVISNFVDNENYYVEFTSATTTTVSNCTSLWFHEPNLPPVTGAYMQVNGANVQPGQYFATTVVAGAQGYNLTSPGIVNIRGARYIKIRCKELEQMIYKDRVGEPSTAGVGIVNLIGYGYSQERYSFSSVPAKSFFPIGKLQKLTFRLERPDGSLYETNGVDNCFLCALTYRVVPNSSAETRFDGPGQYPAAPGYSGDYIQTLQHRWRQEAEATYQSHNKATYDRCRPRTG